MTRMLRRDGRSMASPSWLLLAFVAFGCADSQDVVSDGGSVSLVAPELAADFPAARAEVECAIASRCCGEAGYAGGAPECVQSLTDALSSAPAPSGSYKRDRATDCLRALDAMPCVGTKHMNYQVLQCRDLFSRGSLAVGERCEHYTQCAEPDGRHTTCNPGIEAEGLVKRCAWQVEAELGESCAVSGDDDSRVTCIAGLLCDDKQGVCVAPAKLGEPCLTGTLFGDTCAAGAVCDRANSEHCVEAVPVGGECARVEDCESLACVEGICRGLLGPGLQAACAP